MHRHTLILLAATIGLWGCSEANPGRTGTTGANGGTNGGTNGSTNGGTNGGTNGSTNGATNGSTNGGTTGGNPDGGDPNCGVQNFMLQKGLPPDLLIVLDRSGSMGDDPGNNMGSKWSQITAAINQTVMSLQGQIKWGLEMFPHDNDCGVSSSVDVPVAANNASAISGAINGTMPNGSTPTTDAVKAGTTYLGSLTDSNPKYILLATDGEPNCSTGMSGGACMCPAPTVMMNGQCCIGGIACIPCHGNIAGGPDDVAAVQSITDAGKAGVHTFVVGIAANSADDGVLSQMAMAGGEARAGTPQYYPVTSTMDLVNTINAIAGQIISCSFALQSAPPNPDFVGVDVGGSMVPRDTTHNNGWDFGPGNLSIQFYGAACTSLQTGGASNVQAIFGCGPVS